MIWSLFWKKEATPNIVEEVHGAFVKTDPDARLCWINSVTFKSAITMYKCIWQQRIEEHGYGAPTEDLRIIPNMVHAWDDSPKPMKWRVRKDS